MGASESTENHERWFDEVQSYYWIHNIVHLHRELNFWLIRMSEDGEALTWMELNIEGQHIQPFHFEIYYGCEARRDEYYRETMRQAAREQKMIIGRLNGFCDLVYPVSADENGRTFLLAGQFSTLPPPGRCSATLGRPSQGVKRRARTPISFAS